jgi:hypothetical protein
MSNFTTLEEAEGMRRSRDDTGLILGYIPALLHSKMVYAAMVS